MRTIAIIYKYHYYRVRVSVAHFPRDIMRLCWRVLACRACVMVCMYIDIDIVCSACGSCFRFGLPLVCCWFVPARAMLCCAMCALLSIIIRCTCVTVRCNRFSVLDGVVLPCALSCDCGAFYKCLLCVWLKV